MANFYFKDFDYELSLPVFLYLLLFADVTQQYSESTLCTF